jgi:O-acetyl-ADP-ribose deacetylase (regulator of RNase III)
MIEYVKGNVLDAPANCIVVHGCNSRGVMGSGVALAVKTRFPEAFEIYVRQHYEHGLKLGTFTSFRAEDGPLIVNAITQEFYGKIAQRYVNYEAVAKSFEAILRMVQEKKDWYNEPAPWDTIAFPKIGAGLGGGNWDVISAIIDTTVPDTWKKVCYEL